MGAEADTATRTLTAAWVRAWDELSGLYSAALSDVLVLATTLGRWPYAWELRQVDRLGRAQDAADTALRALAVRTGVAVTDAAGNAIRATGEAEPRLISSQLPAGEQIAAEAQFAHRVNPGALEALVARTGGQVTSAAWPLSAAATEGMKRALIAGVASGTSPRDTARQMMQRVEGGFNGGLARALNIARTETLDAYRATSQYAQAQNRDVLNGWIWTCSFGKRTCPACWAMHGSVHPLSDPGPWDHQSGRCARTPSLLPWSALGINLPEPDSVMPSARDQFDALSHADQLAVMGPRRLELLKSGRIDLPDLAVRRPAGDWRASYAPRPVANLQRIADSRQHAAA